MDYFWNSEEHHTINYGSTVQWNLTLRVIEVSRTSITDLSYLESVL